MIDHMIALALYSLSWSVLQVNSMRCDRIPEGVVGLPSKPHGIYKLEISGNPDNYVPGDEYTGEIVEVIEITTVRYFN